MRGLTNKSPKEMIFAGSCILLLISVFLPYMTIVVDFNDRSNVKSFSIFPSITGFIMLAISVFGVLFILAGLRKRVMYLGIFNALLFIIRLIMDRSAATNFQHTIDTINEMENIMLNVNKQSIVEWWYGSGYFCMLISSILLLGVGIWCFIDKKEDDEQDD